MNEQNLRPVSSESEAREKGRRGGIISGQKRRERKLLRETILDMLSTGDVQDSIVASLLKKAQDGDVRAFEVIRQTIGEDAPKKVELETNEIKIDFGKIEGD